MKNPDEIKQVVKDKYSDIAKGEETGCCSSSCCGSDTEIFNISLDEYKDMSGYVPEADLGLGCGLPTEYAGINKGDTVVDLGSGAGNDVFVARSITGEEGKVIGIDMTEEMIEKANRNNIKLGFNNVEFKLGDIESIPLEDNTADVVISNCVLNLVPDKAKAFSEIYRILKPGAHFCVSDIVIKGEMTEEMQRSAELYAGCISGALKEEEYLGTINSSGFTNVEIKKSKKIFLPDEMLRRYLSEEALKEYHSKMKGIFSITVTGVK
jgi:ubiquinone/menaquinone biosynthesis C-methylase UbiE